MSHKSPFKRSLTDSSYESPSKPSPRKALLGPVSKKYATNASSVSNSSLDVKSQQSVEIEGKEKEFKMILDEIKKKQEDRKKQISAWTKEIEGLAQQLDLDPGEYLERIFRVSD